MRFWLDPVQQTNPRVDEELWRGSYEAADFVGHQTLPMVKQDLDKLEQTGSPQQPEVVFAALKRRWYFEHSGGAIHTTMEAELFFKALQDEQESTQARVSRLLSLINGWWSPRDRGEQDILRLWTRLSYSPRTNWQKLPMVSSRSVPSLSLNLYKPKLSPVLKECFGDPPVDHLLLAPGKDPRFGLKVDARLLVALQLEARGERDQEVERRLVRFNDVMARFSGEDQHTRSVKIFDPRSEKEVVVRVDLNHSRYDSLG